MVGSSPTVRALQDDDREWLRKVLGEAWGLPVVSTTAVYEHPEELEGVIAEINGERVGAVTYNPVGDAWEVVTVNTLRRGLGVGSTMLAAIRELAQKAAASRVWLITADTNSDALAFYERIGMVRTRIHAHFIDKVRAYKSETPGEPFRDAIELEWRLA